MLSDDILFNTFRHCLDATPQFWPILASVNQRWRQIVLTSPLGLNLRLYCTHGRPVPEVLACWPALPIVVVYGGAPNLDPPVPADDDNIIAALKESDRVSYISLTVTRSLVEKLSAISEQISGLEELSLLSSDSLLPTLPNTFRWGPRLRTLDSTGIAFSSFPQLLLPSQGLVDLRIHEIPTTGYFSPDGFASALSGMTNLRLLSLHFLSLPPRRNYRSFPQPSGERVVLPTLTYLKYRGTSKYLDGFVARIDAPRLGDIDITFFYQPTMDASQLGRFIERTEMQTSLIQADVETSAKSISVSFTDQSTCTPLRVQISCTRLDWQLSCMAQVCDQFSSFLFRVEQLSLNTTLSSSGRDDVGGEHKLELVRPFYGTRDFRVADELTTDVFRGFGPINGGSITVFPALRHLRVEKPMAINEPSWDALQSFMTSRSLSGRPVEVHHMTSCQCHTCHASFPQWQERKRQQELKYQQELERQKELERQLEAQSQQELELEQELEQGLERRLKRLQELEPQHQAQHPYRTMCLYCDDFECESGQNDLLAEDLKSKHPKVAHNDALISSGAIHASELRHLVARHSSLHVPTITKPSPSWIKKRKRKILAFRST
jgi:hypothetical protein